MSKNQKKTQQQPEVDDLIRCGPVLFSLFLEFIYSSSSGKYRHMPMDVHEFVITSFTELL